MSAPLKLRAMDADDIAVLAACLQDALVPASDMRYLPAEKRFVLVANRFCWEKLPATALDPAAAPAAGEDEKGPFERVHCGLSIEHVRRVQARGFDPMGATDNERLFEVLSILPEEGLPAEGLPGAGRDGAVLTLVFAGQVAVRLEVERIEIFAQDVGEPWPTLWRPHHPFEGETG
ncbi:MAG: hypothetical protein RL477_41 [Pseudomonadota bacterium]